MAISITTGLRAEPWQTTLPGDVQLLQRLRTIGLPQERVVIEYLLDPRGAVWFNLGGGSPTHCLVFAQDVTSGGTDIAHDVSFLSPYGSPIGAFHIDQVITDSRGRKYVDLCSVGVV